MGENHQQRRAGPRPQRQPDLVTEYTGHPYDAVLGLYFAQARMYDAEGRRFTAKDAVRGNNSQPATIVAYIYCLDNPVRFTDPWGLKSVEEEIADAQAVFEMLKALNFLKFTVTGASNQVIMYGHIGSYAVIFTLLMSNDGAIDSGSFTAKSETARYSFRGSFVGNFDIQYFETISCILRTADEKFPKTTDTTTQGNRGGREIIIPQMVSGVVNGKTETLNTRDNWGGPGGGSYKAGVQKDPVTGRYEIAVGPKIINPNYPDNGKIWKDDFKPFHKEIDVILKHNTTGQIKVVECIVEDVKAHSYNKYPDGHEGKKGYVAGKTASFNVENGLVQTGIAYPNSWNAENGIAITSTTPKYLLVIEFCGQALDFKTNEYYFEKIIVYD